MAMVGSMHSFGAEERRGCQRISMGERTEEKYCAVQRRYSWNFEEDCDKACKVEFRIGNSVAQ